MRFFESYTNESCYWAGFIAADGCIRNCGRQTQFILDWLYGSSQSNCRLDRKYEKGLLACSL